MRPFGAGENWQNPRLASEPLAYEDFSASQLPAQDMMTRPESHLPRPLPPRRSKWIAGSRVLLNVTNS